MQRKKFQLPLSFKDIFLKDKGRDLLPLSLMMSEKKTKVTTFVLNDVS